MTMQRADIEKLEKAFWDSMIHGRPEVATEMLTEPAMMVSSHGVNKFDHAAYTKMANDDRYKLVDYQMTDLDVVFPRDDAAVASYRVNQKMEMKGKEVQTDVYGTSTWLKVDGQWRCALHTESLVAEPSQ